MTIEVNSNFPVQTLRLVVAGALQEVDSSEYLADKKVMLIGVPGAFTKVCSAKHLPGYVNNIDNNLFINLSFSIMTMWITGFSTFTLWLSCHISCCAMVLKGESAR